MQELEINDLIEFNDQKFNAVVLMNEPDLHPSAFVPAGWTARSQTRRCGQHYRSGD